MSICICWCGCANFVAIQGTRCETCVAHSTGVLILILPGSLCGITGSCIGGQPHWLTHYMMTHCGWSY